MKAHRTILGLSLMAGFFAFGLTGCNSARAPYTPNPDQVTAQTYPNIVITPELEHKVAYMAPVVTPAKGGQPMLLRVPIRSLTDHSQFLEYRVIFFAADQEQLTRNPVWYPVQIAARTRKVLNANSISLDATDWEIQIRRAR